MIEKIKEVTKEFFDCKDLKTWLKLFSVLTWNKIGFARTRNRLKIYETTITQELLFAFRMFAEGTNLPIELFEALSEKTNGNDFEILIEIGYNKYVMFPCQAKIIYANGGYKAIDHLVSNKQQITLLTNYANKYGGIPIYLFYNYFCPSSELNKIIKTLNYDIEEYGCSIVDASYIEANFFKFDNSILKINKIPKFSHLHPSPAIPFHQVIDMVGNYNKIKYLFKHFFIHQNKEIKIYSREELLNDKNWSDLVPMPYIGRIEPENQKTLNKLNNDEIEHEFSPKFRFIFSIEKNEKKVTIGAIG